MSAVTESIADRIDPVAYEQLQGKVVDDVAGAIGLLMAWLGDQTGIYRALAAHGPCTTHNWRSMRVSMRATCANGCLPMRHWIT